MCKNITIECRFVTCTYSSVHCCGNFITEKKEWRGGREHIATERYIVLCNRSVIAENMTSVRLTEFLTVLGLHNRQHKCLATCVYKQTAYNLKVFNEKLTFVYALSPSRLIGLMIIRIGFNSS